MQLVNKTPFRRILEVTGISFPTLYGKIEFLHEQCIKFVGNRERHLARVMRLPRLHICVDRQDYVVNWSQREDKRNIILHGVGSADNASGYVFGMHLNFDPAMSPAETESAAILAGDYDLPPQFRRYARLWLRGDYEAAVAVSKKRQQISPSARRAIDQRIAATYAEAQGREDTEVAEIKDSAVQLPTRGMQVHSEYTLYGHFRHLRQLLGGARKINFYLDQDSGMRAACLSMFEQEIKDGRADAFYVRIAKESTVPEKQAALTESRNEFDRQRALHPELSEQEVKLLMIREQMENMSEFGRWNDRWLSHPFPNMSEPQKSVCHLTRQSNTDEHELEWMYYKASLHSIDRFFMLLRRRVSILERSFESANTGGRRMWYGYNAYNPEIVVKLLEIFRVYYNYCFVGKDGETAAMRFGLAKGIVTPEDVIYFQE